MEPIADNQITITESGAFIPRSLFGHDVELTETLRQVGVLSTMNGQTIADPTEPKSKPIKRVEPIDLSLEFNWLKAHRSEYSGQWVALDGECLIAHGVDARKVYQAAREVGVLAPLLSRFCQPTICRLKDGKVPSEM